MSYKLQPFCSPATEPLLNPILTFDCHPAQVLEVSPEDGKQKPVEDDTPDMPGLQISLDAGQGRLFPLPQKR